MWQDETPKEKLNGLIRALDAEYMLSVSFVGADGSRRLSTIKIHEIDQDKDAGPPFKVTVDFSKDRTGFFSDPQKRSIIQACVDDWAYFIDDMNLDPVPAGTESTFIWNPDGFVSGSLAKNSQSYVGFLLYAYGIHSPQLRSGGEPSGAGGYQSSRGVALPLRRSGGVEIETSGNFNALGWFLTTSDDDWWKSGNLGNELNDLWPGQPALLQLH